MTDDLERFYAIIPAGGIGSRLWPLSRADAPKFLHDLTGTGASLLRSTWDRLAPLSGDQRIMVVTGRAHRAAVERQLPGLADHNVVLESEPKDSTAAIGLAAAILRRREPDVVIGSFAADHVIGDVRGFRRSVREAVVAAEAGYITTIGITPTEPAIGFGYIHAGERIHVDSAKDVHAVQSFVEKPDLETATAYVADGSYMWNAGMFIARADRLLEEIGRSEPELLAGIEELAAAWDTSSRGAVVDQVWPRLKKIAIDYTVAEPAAAAGRMAVVPGDFDWDDVGDFASLAKLQSGGRPHNLAVLGDNARILADSSSGIVVSHSDRLISLIGVDDIVVVDTPDALLVTTSANAQRVKGVVDALKISGRDDVL
ncbi:MULTISPECIES: mannose-1-phosphate guanylyltransferase [unclassified Curtobacterium]|uniref:mannose-1-phosphate guanylyltransferase n=1 Tax=unclassified Curtobacterium TaxID=257496 RepID=UPI000DA8D4DA|nr:MULTISPECIES: mannose-1-phosphate guanylyltransferase [unclassified Curtobacterium]PZE26451.1 mannose-1-phosphate guanylyltransferase [Curtobacterium sp. MCBD17_028]PZE75109.1 mannose-1-phosphate guanylyltransferase [Curtobacterium sp. MCBD17_019]PZF64408.1 mannose-1-phosphate guanylyltransferase [Curtobacterium sp. MCBD17_013]WIB62605.1 mannose-1-phosphate guanylyltransferase [Curtobacterium sp. MCBD17_040]WIB66442.1 mannose-1-phosphate guanylyltransferase [Curtobacterium sp. MCBD17_035]